MYISRSYFFCQDKDFTADNWYFCSWVFSLKLCNPPLNILHCHDHVFSVASMVEVQVRFTMLLVKYDIEWIKIFKDTSSVSGGTKIFKYWKYTKFTKYSKTPQLWDGGTKILKYWKYAKYSKTPHLWVGGTKIFKYSKYSKTPHLWVGGTKKGI